MPPSRKTPKTGRAPERRPPERRERANLGIDLTLCPTAWLPEAIGPGSTVTFTARIYVCGEGGWAPAPAHHAREIEFRLSMVSSERGNCLNKGSSRNPDLWFPVQPGFAVSDDATVDARCDGRILGRPNAAHRHFQVAKTRARVTSATVTVRCEDYGAWGRLDAFALNCVPIPAREDAAAPVACPAGVCCEGPNSVLIPRDGNANHIADAAPQDAAGAGLPGARTDDDAAPRSARAGDGLTAYEEYRGFFVGGGAVPEAHIRTDIGVKDIFVFVPDGLSVGHFPASGLAVHVLRDPALYGGHARRANFNRGYASGGAQHGLRLATASLSGTTGQILPDPGRPGQVVEAQVDLASCAGNPAMLACVIAHELGHGVAILHHGSGLRHTCPTPRPSLRRFTEDRGQKSSGDSSCVMRYAGYSRGWCTRHARWFPFEDPPAYGTAFCRAATGTGANAPAGGPRNDAARGDCAGQIIVKDW